jgi:tetratricopeptide (TPR) repeat protein
MHWTWFQARHGVVLVVTAWFATAAGILNASTISTTPAPLTVVNPFATQKSPSPRPVATPTPPQQQSAAASPIAAAKIDADVPVAYRLPTVSPPASATSEPMTASTAAKPSVNQTDQPADEEPKGDIPTDPSLLAGATVREIRPAQMARPAAVQIGMPPIIDRKRDRRNSVPFEPPAIDVVPTGPSTSATHEVTSQLLPAVQRGYDLAQRGALYAAQTEFVQVLRRIAQAQDAASGSDGNSRALAAGLRALDEAEDFVPTGIQVEAELDVQIVASSHRTPVLREQTEPILPHRAVELYHTYAEGQLAQAVGGAQAGSMALHGLGKIFALLAVRNDDDALLTQRAAAMYTAALTARRDNHLAANELGVLLCRSGRPAEAMRLFERTIDAEPSALAYHNLAVAQRKLGMHGQAAANEQESQRLAAWERASGSVSRRAGVQWVSSEELARVAQPALLAPAIHHVANPPAPAALPMAGSAPPAQPSAWQRTVAAAKSLPLPGIGSTRRSSAPVTSARVPRPLVAPPVASQTRWR